MCSSWQWVNTERQGLQPQETTTWTTQSTPSYLEPNLPWAKLTTFKATAVPDRRRSMNSAAFCKEGKMGKMAELSYWSRGPEPRGQVEKLLVQADPNESLTSAFQMLPGQCLISMCLSLCREKSKLHSTWSSSLSLSRSVGWAVSCWRLVKE